MDITRTEFLASLDGVSLTACAVRDENIFYFNATRYDDEINPAIAHADLEQSLIRYFRDDPEGKRWGHVGYKGFQRVHAAASVEPKPQLVGMDRDGNVIVLGSGAQDFEEPVSPPNGGSIESLRTIGGHVHALSSHGGLLRRDGADDWRATTIAQTRQTDWTDLDGFAADHLYAIARTDTIWRLRGSAWSQVPDIPQTDGLVSVCCGGDGIAYIGTAGGTVLAIDDNGTRVAHRPEKPKALKSLTWFDDKLWVMADDLYILKDDALAAVPPDPERIGLPEMISAKDGILLIAHALGASFLRSGAWTKLFDYQGTKDWQ